MNHEIIAFLERLYLKKPMMKATMFCIAVLFLSACDGGGGNGSNNAVNPSTIPEGLPPDPGEAGKLTVEGIDSDNDGVRDDIQRYIAIEYQDSEKTRRVLTDMAKADQEFLVNADDKNKVLEATATQSKQNSCAFYIDPDEAHQKLKKLKAEILNTEERIRAWIKADSHLGGMAFSVPLMEEWKNQCNFDPDQLEN